MESNLEEVFNILTNEADDIKAILRKIILDYQKTEIVYNKDLDKLLCLLLTKFSKVFETEDRILLMNAICVLLKSLSRKQHDIVVVFIKAILEKDIKESFHFISCIINLFETDKAAIQLYFIESVLKYDILDKCTEEQGKMSLLLDMFEITEKFCLNCQKITFVSFRCLHKLVNNFTKYDYWHILDKRIVQKILLIVNSNWDNSVTGVRENNCKILNETLKNLESTEVQIIFQETSMNLSWLCKSKYFIIIEIFKTLTSDYVFKNFMETDKLQDIFNLNIQSFCDGLLSSLSSGGVTSAGTNLFIEVWKSVVPRNYLKQKMLEIFKTESMNVIQNLYNYWLPHIVKTTPEVIMQFFEDLKSSTDPKHWYSVCCILVLCRKNGLLNDIYEDKNIVQLLCNCSIHSNESLRSIYFQFICICPKTFASPIDREYDMVKNFLFCNINSDCTYLRQSIANSFTLFIIRIRDSSLNNLKLLKNDDTKNIAHQHLSSMADFMVWIHKFLIFNLNLEANYQRKYLSLMLYDIVLRYLNGGTENIENKHKGLCRKGNMKNQGIKICKFLKNENKWQYTDENSLELLLRCVLDPTNDVRELAVKIMKEYFIYSDFAHANDIILKAFGLCNSTISYEVECGALYLVLLLNLNEHDVILTWTNDILDIKALTIVECLTRILESQFNEFKNDCIRAVLNNKPIYGVLTAIKFILNNCTLSKLILNFEALNYILKTIEKISSYCLESFAATAPASEYMVAPSFSEMDDAITYLITKSEMDDEHKTLNMNQDVFNCIWMSLRLCTDICSSLAVAAISQKSFNIDTDEVINECAIVIVSALTRCRHKGVIEGAGVSLGNFIRQLTKTYPDSQIPENILKKHILSTLTTTYKGPSMTRRGAGMGILFHKLISSDSRDNKPLLKYAMINLLRILKQMDKECLNECVEITLSDLNISDKEKETINKQGQINDVIEASALHYIKGLVQDSSLKVDLAPYMSQLTILAFKYFFDPSWPIRNAALQLFGAIVPKFIGQKKGLISTIEENTNESQSSEGILHIKMDYLFVDVGELLLHYPDLSNSIETILIKKTNNELSANRISTQASLVPVLSLLSGSIVGLTILYEEGLKEKILNFQKSFIKLFSSPIQVVRNLSAKCYACMTSLPDLENKIMTICNDVNLAEDENFKHGSLLALSYLIDKFSVQGKYMFNTEIATNISNRLLNLCNKFNSSTFYTRTLYLDMMCSISKIQVDLCWINAYEELLEFIKSGIEIDFGMPIYVQNLTKTLVNYCDFKLIHLVLEILLRTNITDVLKTFFIYFTQKIDSLSNSMNENFNKQIIFNTLFNYLLEKNKCTNVDVIYLIMKVMHKLVTPHVECEEKKIKKMFKLYVNKHYFSINISTLAISVISSILNNSFHQINNYYDWTFISLLITLSCNYAEYCTEDVRMNVTKSLINIIFLLYKQCKMQVDFSKSALYFEEKVKCVNSIINLMQDENVEIRNEATKFYSLYIKYEGGLINPTLCLLSFLNSAFLKHLFGDSNIYLNKKIEDIESQNRIDSQNAESLQYVSNVFYETFFLKIIIQKFIMTQSLNSDFTIHNDYYKIL